MEEEEEEGEQRIMNRTLELQRGLDPVDPVDPFDWAQELQDGMKENF